MDYEAEVVSVDSGEPAETQVAETQPEVVETTESETEEVVETTKEPEKVEENNLVELPDGRKLPPKEAEVEYRNLYSEFTRRSQKLATFEKGTSEVNNPVEKKDWVPETWDEVVERSKQAIREDLDRERTAEENFRKQSEEYVSTQLTELKQSNPNLNETALFNHALKYGFQDLKQAHTNMRDMQAQIKKATDTTVQNIQKRNAEPISGGSQAGSVYDGDMYDPSARNMSLVDELRKLK